MSNSSASSSSASAPQPSVLAPSAPLAHAHPPVRFDPNGVSPEVIQSLYDKRGPELAAIRTLSEFHDYLSTTQGARWVKAFIERIDRKGETVAPGVARPNSGRTGAGLVGREGGGGLAAQQRFIAQQQQVSAQQNCPPLRTSLPNPSRPSSSAPPNGHPPLPSIGPVFLQQTPNPMQHQQPLPHPQHQNQQYYHPHPQMDQQFRQPAHPPVPIQRQVSNPSPNPPSTSSSHGQRPRHLSSSRPVNGGGVPTAQGHRPGSAAGSVQQSPALPMPASQRSSPEVQILYVALTSASRYRLPTQADDLILVRSLTAEASLSRHSSLPVSQNSSPKLRVSLSHLFFSRTSPAEESSADT
jgi:hypothetical protein